MLSGNKGEWSEIYTLLKILADKNLFAGNSNMEKIEALIYPIVKVLRDESNGTYEFSYYRDIVVVKGEENEFRIPIQVFHQNSKTLLDKIKAAKKSSFEIPEIETFLNSFNCKSLKAKSSVKSDIRVVIHDLRTGSTPELGFSIKSQLGGASTLLNAGKTTNFVFKVSGLELNEHQISEINSINTRSKIKDRIESITKLGGVFEFKNVQSSVFGNNLTLIDSSLPKIISEILFQFFTTTDTKLVDLVDVVSLKNPLGFDTSLNHPFYVYKVKRLLTDIALGMMPSKVWTGLLDATGGYLIVKETGDILCYHIYNRNEFENYLLHNTKLETASSTRHQFGSLYTSNGCLFFNLNLQVRFIK